MSDEKTKTNEPVPEEGLPPTCKYQVLADGEVILERDAHHAITTFLTWTADGYIQIGLQMTQDDPIMLIHAISKLSAELGKSDSQTLKLAGLAVKKALASALEMGGVVPDGG